MRKISAKQRNIAQRNALWRREFVLSVGHCQLCKCKAGERHKDGHFAMCLVVHEMMPGANRIKSIEAGPNACMVVCQWCNTEKLPGMPLARQLAIKVTDEGQRPTADTQRYIDRIDELLATVRAVKNNGRSPVVVEFLDVHREVCLLDSA